MDLCGETIGEFPLSLSMDLRGRTTAVVPDITTTFPPYFYWPPGIPKNALIPVVFSNSFSYMLVGAVAVQVSFYLHRYKNDGKMRWVIWALFLCDLLHTGIQVFRDLLVLAVNFGDWGYLGNFHERHQELVIPVISVTVISTCQAIIATRSYLFSRSLDAGGQDSRFILCSFAAKLLLIFASMACGIASVAFLEGYKNLYELSALNKIGESLFPLFETLWLVLGTIADLAIAWSMWSDARSAQTGFGTSSDSVLQVLVKVGLRCGLTLALTQMTLLILYFANTPSWSDAAHSILPRISTLTLLYSISSPREAYRALLHQQQHHPHRFLSERARSALERVSLRNTGHLHDDQFGVPSLARSTGAASAGSGSRSGGGLLTKKGGGGLLRKFGARVSFLGVGRSKEGRKARREDGHGVSRGSGDDKMWVEEGRGARRRKSWGIGAEEEHVPDGGEKETRLMVETRSVGETGMVATRSVILSVETVSDERSERLGEQCGGFGQSSPLRFRSTIEALRAHPRRTLSPAFSLSTLRRNLVVTPPPPHNEQSPHGSLSASPPAFSCSIPPNFIDSFPSRPTASPSPLGYDESEMDELYVLEKL